MLRFRQNSLHNPPRLPTNSQQQAQHLEDINHQVTSPWNCLAYHAGRPRIHELQVGQSQIETAAQEPRGSLTTSRQKRQERTRGCSLTNSKATKKTADQEHGNVSCAALQGASNNGNWCRDQKGLFPTQIIASPANEDGAEESTSRKASVHGSNDAICVIIQSHVCRVLGKTKVLEEPWLTESS